MKIINQGIPPDEIKKWWHGATGKCRSCGRVVQLERGDELDVTFIEVTANEVRVNCGNCFERIVIKKP